MTPVRTTVALCIFFIAVVVGLFVNSVTRTPTLTEEELRAVGTFILPRPREITPFELNTHTGAAFDLDDLQGRWTFAFFGFTNCPDICPTTMAVMGQAYRTLAAADAELAGLFQGVLVSVDPERDDAETLGRYVSAFSADFLGVRGEPQALAVFADQVNVAFAKVPRRDEAGEVLTDSYDVDHSANIVIINPRGHYHGFIKYPQTAENVLATFRSLQARF
ncbi:MAG: SCO family protein [Pseudomonadales bacterium]|nr:SCO family protein [Pseudomonadales bacterium]